MRTRETEKYARAQAPTADADGDHAVHHNATLRRARAVLLLALCAPLAFGACALWPGGGDDATPPPAELPDPRAQKEKRKIWLPKISLANPARWFGRGRKKTPAGPSPDLAVGLSVVENTEVQAFYQRASNFYAQLAGRRFNTLATYRDPRLRDYFKSDSNYIDYYASMTQALRFTAFEQNTPLQVDVLEVQVEAPGRARVVTRVVGANALPLRWWETELHRVDRWERSDGIWWLVPGRL